MHWFWHDCRGHGCCRSAHPLQRSWAAASRRASPPRPPCPAPPWPAHSLTPEADGWVSKIALLIVN
jgi:hypothetical protein